jgi:hypothetical protein
MAWRSMSSDAPFYVFQQWYIPGRMGPLLVDYLEKGLAPDDPFLDAVLCDELVEACQHADHENLRNLPAYAAYLLNEAASACWGSRQEVEAWLARRRKDDDTGAEPGQPGMKPAPKAVG